MPRAGEKRWAIAKKEFNELFLTKIEEAITERKPFEDEKMTPEQNAKVNETIRGAMNVPTRELHLERAARAVFNAEIKQFMKNTFNGEETVDLNALVHDVLLKSVDTKRMTNAVMAKLTEYPYSTDNVEDTFVCQVIKPKPKPAQKPKKSVVSERAPHDEHVVLEKDYTACNRIPISENAKIYYLPKYVNTGQITVKGYKTMKNVEYEAKLEEFEEWADNNGYIIHFDQEDEEEEEEEEDAAEDEEDDEVQLMLDNIFDVLDTLDLKKAPPRVRGVDKNPFLVNYPVINKCLPWFKDAMRDSSDVKRVRSILFALSIKAGMLPEKVSIEECGFEKSELDEDDNDFTFNPPIGVSLFFSV